MNNTWNLIIGAILFIPFSALVLMLIGYIGGFIYGFLELGFKESLNLVRKQMV